LVKLLYLWLIAQGEDVLLSAFRDPDSLASLPSIPFGDAAFKKLTEVVFDDSTDDDDEMLATFNGTEFVEEIADLIFYKNDDKYGSYEHLEDAMGDAPNLLPKLIARAKESGFDWEYTYYLNSAIEKFKKLRMAKGSPFAVRS
jgi:hypothetical protein